MRGFWIRVLSAGLVVGMLGGYNQVLASRAKDEEIARLNAQITEGVQSETEGVGGTYKDGTYEGEADGFGGKIAVKVTIAEGSISDIQITESAGEDGAYLAMAKDIIPVILEAQNSEVDTISGATFSSTGIREGVKMALEKAGN